MDPNGEAKKALAEQKKMDEEQQAIALATAVQKKFHEMMMSIIANIR